MQFGNGFRFGPGFIKLSERQQQGLMRRKSNLPILPISVTSAFVKDDQTKTIDPWTAYAHLIAGALQDLELGKKRETSGGLSLVQLAELLNEHAKEVGSYKCTYSVKSLRDLQKQPSSGKSWPKPRAYRVEHLHQFFSEVLRSGKSSRQLAAIKPDAIQSWSPEVDSEEDKPNAQPFTTLADIRCKLNYAFWNQDSTDRFDAALRKTFNASKAMEGASASKIGTLFIEFPANAGAIKQNKLQILFYSGSGLAKNADTAKPRSFSSAGDPTVFHFSKEEIIPVKKYNTEGVHVSAGDRIVLLAAYPRMQRFMLGGVRGAREEYCGWALVDVAGACWNNGREIDYFFAGTALNDAIEISDRYNVTGNWVEKEKGNGLKFVRNTSGADERTRDKAIKKFIATEVVPIAKLLHRKSSHDQQLSPYSKLLEWLEAWTPALFKERNWVGDARRTSSNVFYVTTSTQIYETGGGA